jgi:hypothetical protein
MQCKSKIVAARIEAIRRVGAKRYGIGEIGVPV